MLQNFAWTLNLRKLNTCKMDGNTLVEWVIFWNRISRKYVGSQANREKQSGQEIEM